MNKNKLFLSIIIFLAILNIILLYFVFSRKRPHHVPRNYIIQKLELTNSQINQYDKLIQWHRHNADSAQNELMKNKSLLYELSAKEENDSLKKQYIQNIGQSIQYLEAINFKHFQDIGTLCQGNQKQKFKELSSELQHLFSPGMKGKNK